MQRRGGAVGERAPAPRDPGRAHEHDVLPAVSGGPEPPVQVLAQARGRGRSGGGSERAVVLRAAVRGRLRRLLLLLLLLRRARRRNRRLVCVRRDRPRRVRRRPRASDDVLPRSGVEGPPGDALGAADDARGRDAEPPGAPRGAPLRGRRGGGLRGGGSPRVLAGHVPDVRARRPGGGVRKPPSQPRAVDGVQRLARLERHLRRELPARRAVRGRHVLRGAGALPPPLGDAHRRQRARGAQGEDAEEERPGARGLERGPGAVRAAVRRAPGEAPEPALLLRRPAESAAQSRPRAPGDGPDAGARPGGGPEGPAADAEAPRHAHPLELLERVRGVRRVRAVQGGGDRGEGGEGSRRRGGGGGGGPGRRGRRRVGRARATVAEEPVQGRVPQHQRGDGLHLVSEVQAARQAAAPRPRHRAQGAAPPGAPPRRGADEVGGGGARQHRVQIQPRDSASAAAGGGGQERATARGFRERRREAPSLGRSATRGDRGARTRERRSGPRVASALERGRARARARARVGRGDDGVARRRRRSRHRRGVRRGGDRPGRRAGASGRGAERRRARPRPRAALRGGGVREESDADPRRGGGGGGRRRGEGDDERRGRADAEA